MSPKEAEVARVLIRLGGSHQTANALIQHSSGSLKRGSTYTLLNRMIDKEYVEDYMDLYSTGQQRRMYRLTPKGKAMFKAIEQYAKERKRIGA